MLSDKLVASPLVWIIGALVAIMCLLPSAVAIVLGKDPIAMLTNCTIAIASALFYSKEMIVTTWIMGAVMMLFLKKWRLALMLAIVPAACVYGSLVLGSFVLHARKIQNVTAPMYGLISSIYIGDTASMLILSYLLPGIIAFKRGRKNRRKIILSNIFLAWIPGAWPLLLFLSSKD